MDLARTRKVSVLVITYNHEAYIEQAISSILVQRTSFEFEIVVGDDCSSDSTRSILERMSAKHPGRIKLLDRPQNLGMMQNAINAYSHCAGEYIAFLEGDDFWTDDFKLQRQVELLDGNERASMCVHATSYVSHTGHSLPNPWPSPAPAEFIVDNFLRSNPVHISSVVLRRSMQPKLPTYLSELRVGDWPICILLALQGPCLAIDREMSSYRVHSGGSWSAKSSCHRNEAVIDMFLLMLAHHPEHFAILSRAVKVILDQERILRESFSCRLGFALTSPIRTCVARLRRHAEILPWR